PLTRRLQILRAPSRSVPFASTSAPDRRCSAAPRVLPAPCAARTARRASMTPSSKRQSTLEPENTERLANLAGPFDAHLRQIEQRLGVESANRGAICRVTGPGKAPASCATLLRARAGEAAGEPFDSEAIDRGLDEAKVDHGAAGGVEAQDVA